MNDSVVQRVFKADGCGLVSTDQTDQPYPWHAFCSFSVVDCRDLQAAIPTPTAAVVAPSASGHFVTPVNFSRGGATATLGLALVPSTLIFRRPS
jgi:hypothetical protein